MSLIDWLRRRPQHCETCGDQFVTTEYRDGYRTGDGSPIVRTWAHCPRNDDQRPDLFEFRRFQRGACYPLSPFACLNEIAAYRNHRPTRGACRHHTVSKDGENCWAKDGTPITVNSTRVERPA